MRILTLCCVVIGLLRSFYSIAQEATPAGDNHQIQFNNSGSFGASPYLRWTGTHLYLDDMGSTSPFIYMRSESGDWSRIFSENYGSNLNRLVIHTGDDGDGDYTVFRNKHWSYGDLDVFEIHRSFMLARGGRVWSTTTQGISKGVIHLDPENSTDYAGSAITFGASDSGGGETAQAGIYVRTDGSFGSKMYFSTTNSYAQGAKTKMTIDHVGNIGIGTPDPKEELHIVKNVNTLIRLEDTSANGSIVKIGSVSSNGKKEAQLQFEQELGFFDHAQGAWRLNVKPSGYVGIGIYEPNARLHIKGSARESLRLTGAGSPSKYLSLWQGTGSGVIDAVGSPNLYVGYDHEADVIINRNGSKGVAIGTGSVPPDYKLAVNGKAIMEEVKVELSGTWPDYVFEPTYDLKSLEEIEKFIQSNHHLPEVPSAKEMEANGVQLGEMNMLLLKKIEELTLHTIEQEKKLKKQGDLENKLEEMMKLIEYQQKEIELIKNSPRQPQADSPLFSKREKETEHRRGELGNEAKQGEL